DIDRINFLDRLGKVISETKTKCFAWALIPNHFHLLLRTGNCPLSTVMRRLLTGHAINFNGRHHRIGHLFQNRYKSILCQEDTYLLELVRYLHLNPIRAKLVTDIQELDKYPFCGHAVIMLQIFKNWTNTLFADTPLSWGKRKECGKMTPMCCYCSAKIDQQRVAVTKDLLRMAASRAGVPNSPEEDLSEATVAGQRSSLFVGQIFI
ncbi:MAG: transposase, partial [Deltaproteobacteria bacterium]|nr:transposase [Deltaproteobacteria bacterium]